MNGLIKDFILNERVCALSSIIPSGYPHTSALHYSASLEPVLELYFSVDKKQKKSEFLVNGNSTKASVAIGFSEVEWRTLQMDGELFLVDNLTEIAKIKNIHYSKISTAKAFEKREGTIFMKFVPDWLRYSDFNADPLILIEENLN